MPGSGPLRPFRVLIVGFVRSFLHLPPSIGHVLFKGRKPLAWVCQFSQQAGRLSAAGLDGLPDNRFRLDRPNLLPAVGQLGQFQDLYLTEVDKMLEKAKETTRNGKYTYLEYARYADDLVILVDALPRHDWLLQAVNKRLREELAKLHVEINEEKSRIVDLGKGESFGFLGFEFRRVRSRKGAWRPRYTPKRKKRTALLDKLKDIFRCFQSQPIDRVVALINPILRGWVRYFAIGDSSRCFGYIKDWVEKKVRRHLMRARGLRGFGWDRWSRRWLYEHLGLFEGYRVSRPPKALPSG